MIKKKLGKLIALLGMSIAADALSVHASDSPLLEKVHESKYHMPFPLQKGGEKIDVLVRVDETDRAYGLYLIFVLKASWPEAKKEELIRLYQGRLAWPEPIKPYPIKIRLRIDSADQRNEVHIDRLVGERSPRYGRGVNDGAETWFAEALFFGTLPAGVYRVRLENTVPVPEIDFETLVAFEKDNRKY